MSDPRLARAAEHERRREVLQAEMLYAAVLRDHANDLVATTALARMAVDRGDVSRALELLLSAARVAPGDRDVLRQLAELQFRQGHLDDALSTARLLTQSAPSDPMAWLLLAHLRQARGEVMPCAKAWWRAATAAQRQGRWLGPDSIEPDIRDYVTEGLAALMAFRRAHLAESFDQVRRDVGANALGRVEFALQGYLGDHDATPPDPRQRPKFFYFPGLNDRPYHDPMTQPWAPRLRDAWQTIRDEALGLQAAGEDFESFLGLAKGERNEAYVSGDNPNASWDAYFFYRHGQRFDAHHAQCPQTSAVLESVELCHIAGQAPEVCFSVLQPQSTIVRHFGVTNTRLVMHVPLVVPPDCALNIIEVGPHEWREGELMMFDDTYQHEAWNRSDRPRIILLMDCWHPELHTAEKHALRLLIEAIDRFENAD